MKLLLTSNGICNSSIKKALSELIDKPFSETTIAFIPTAANADPTNKEYVVDDLVNIKNLKLKMLDIVDISALPRRLWLPRLEKSDVLFFSGGMTPHLMYWINKSGLAELLPKMLETRVYAGISAGSMVSGPSIVLSNQDKKIYYEKWTGYGSDKGLHLVDFYVRPHLNSRFFPLANPSFFADLAKSLKDPIYVLDDQSALKVVNNKIEIISEGDFLVFNERK